MRHKVFIEITNKFCIKMLTIAEKTVFPAFPKLKNFGN